MSIVNLTAWLDEQTRPNVVWYVKRLAANDTKASGGNQAGPYIPREFLFSLFPSLNRPSAENPDTWFDLHIDSHGDSRKIRLIWYNNKSRGGKKNETRLTNFGGSASALLDPESTGALVVFAFLKNDSGDAPSCRCWVCENEIEEELIEDRIGTVEPGTDRVWSVNESQLALFPRSISKCWLEPNEIPDAWRTRFPSGADIIRRTVQLRPAHGMEVDVRLLKRRECEYEMFRSLEENVELPMVRAGFSSIDEFVARAQTVLQRRKARSGRSLELHAREIFIEENLQEHSQFSHQPESEKGHRPDFLFPSQQAYKDSAFPADRLRMLAVKTTCKDRWRQILNEASRVSKKHLLTLQEGVSEAQFAEMTEEGVQLVVPAPLISSYPESVRPHLLKFESFISDVRLLTM